MPLSVISIAPGDRQAARDAGFTMAGPYYKLDQRNVELIKSLGAMGFKTFWSLGNKEMIGNGQSADQLRGEIRGQIDAVLKDTELNRHVAWWYVGAEELRYWKADEMQLLQIVSEEARQRDPLKRPVWMYEPNNRDAAALVKTGQFQDIIGKGSYVNYAKKPRVWVRWSIEQETEAGKVLNSNPALPGAHVPIAVLEMFADPPKPEDRILIPAWVRHDTYLSLVCGAKGIVVFSGWARPGFTTHPDYLKAYCAIVAELTGNLHLDQVFLFGQRRSNISVLTQGVPRTIACDDKNSYPPIAFLDVAYGQDRYFFAVNSADRPVQAKVIGLPYAKFPVEDLFGKSPVAVSSGSFKVTFEPLEVRGWKFSRRMGEAAADRNPAATTKLQGSEPKAADSSQSSTLRSWSDNTGKHRIEAEFVSVADGRIKLRKPTGEIISLPLERLSEQDRAWVQKQGK